jgi:Na+/proline symporter
MMLGIGAALVFLLISVGGVGEVVATAEAAGKWSLFGNWANESGLTSSAPIIAFSFFVPTMLLLMGDANMYQRIFSARDGGSAKKAVLFWVVGVMVLETSIYFLGLTGSVAAAQGLIPELFPGGPADTAANLSENIIPTVAREAVPLVVGMLLVATMMAIVVSTADSFLLVPATNLTRDVYQRFITPHIESPRFVAVGRGVMVIVGILFMLTIDHWLWRAGVLVAIGAGVALIPREPHLMLSFVVRYALVLTGLFVLARLEVWWLQVLVALAVLGAMRIVPDDEEARVVFVSRFMVLFLGFVAYLLVDQFPTILAAAYTAYLIYGAGITPALIAAFTWKRATKEGAVASLLSGAGVTLLWTFYLADQPFFETWHPFLQQVTYPAVTASVVALVAVSLLTPAPSPDKWKPFFRDSPDHA